MDPDPQIDKSWLGEKPAEPVSPSRIPRQAASVPLPPVRSRLAGSLIGGVVAITLILTGLVLFLLSEAGALTLGIEQWWGLSNKPAEALEVASQSLASTERYTLEADLTLTLGGTPELPVFSQHQRLFGIESAVAAPSPATTLHLLLAQSVTPEASRLQVRLLSGTSSSEVQALPLFSGAAPTRFDLVTAGSSLYLNLPEDDPDTWVKVGISELSTIGLSSLEWPALFERLSSHLTSGKRSSGRTIHGESAKGYRVTIPTVELARLLVPSSPPLSGTITADVWVGTSSGLPYLVELLGTAGNGTLTGSIAFADFDGAVAVGLPDPESVTEESLADWLQTHHVLAGDTPIGRDAERKRDLMAIQTALEEFAAAQSPFGYPKVENAVNVADLADELKLYLDPLPTDPSTDRSYQYRSGGSSYELSATLEIEEETYVLKP